MTQIWMLIYLLEYYKSNKNFHTLTRIGRGEERLRKMLRFLKEDCLMIDIREKLTETLLGYAAKRCYPGRSTHSAYAEQS
jgi:hypothetical protein